MNVVVIRCDQGRRSAFGCYGNTESQTPAIDALAAESEKFTNAYSTEPVCSAMRTAFDVGKHTHATPNADKLHPSDRTIHGMLDAAGVDTLIVGKWHKTPAYLIDPSEPERVPTAILRGIHRHVGHEDKHELVLGPYWFDGTGSKMTSGPWRPQTYVNEFLGLLSQASEPFYAVLDLEPPHTPYNVIEGTAWDVFSPGAMTLPPNVPPNSQFQAKQDLAAYYGMLLSVDDMVGQVMEALATGGYLTDTTVIFTSDHGAHIGAHGLTGVEEQKRTIYREAIEVPLLIRHPCGVGSVSAEVWGTTRFYPYILDLFGVPHGPGAHWGKEPEGIYFEQLDGTNTPKGAWRGILKDGHRYARAEQTGPWKLYHADDLHDEENLVGQENPLEAEMDGALQAAAAALGDTIPW
jgi:arylsulfatase A-like enzyme